MNRQRTLIACAVLCLCGQVLQAQELAFKPFEKAVYSQQFYAGDTITYRHPHTAVVNCRINEQEEGGLILRVSTPVFPDPKLQQEPSARLTSTELPYTVRGLDLQKVDALSFDWLATERTFPVFPDNKVKVGDSWTIEAPPILYVWGRQPDKDRRCHVRHTWRRTVEKDKRVCANIEITIDDEYLDEETDTQWTIGTTGVVFFAIEEGVPVWEDIKVVMTKERAGKKTVDKASRMLLLLEYEPSPGEE